jgi:hypothetical protein
MQSKQKSKWWIDATLFAGLITACFVNLTGIDLHQWIGVGAGLVALYHLLTHLDWVEAVTKRFFGKTSAISRIYYLIDAALMSGFFTMIATGLVMSTWLNLDLANFGTWRTVHIAATVLTVATTLAKLILHRNWIVQTARKWVFPGASPAAPTMPTVPAMAGGMSRRAFLGTMGTVGVASILALGQSIQSLQNSLQAPATSNTTTSSTAKTANIAAAVNTSDTAATCVLRCNKGCSFPGRCKRYTDSNGNGKCDFTECT